MIARSGKHIPTPTIFDISNLLHLQFVAHSAYLRAVTYSIPIPDAARGKDGGMFFIFIIIILFYFF
jgi:hypothetical protein